MANDLFPVATFRPALKTTPNPRPKADPAPIAPDPAADGVTWYTLQDGSMIPGEGTYVDIVAQNIEEIIICANNIDSIIQAVDANVQAQDAANRAAASATAAANSASAANGSASLASASASAAQTSAVNAAASASNAATSASGASGSATAAAGSATAAANSATASANSATASDNSWRTFNSMWYGPYAAAPTVDPFGGAPNPGDVYFNTTSNLVQVRGNTTWQTVTAGVTSVAGKSGTVILVHNDISDWDATLASYATLASPIFTGTPSLPAGAVAVTAAPGDNDTSIATTAFVTNATKTSGVTVGDIAPVAPADGLLWFDSIGLQLYLRYNDGNSAQWVPTINQINGGAPLASPAFTGNPTAPTPPVGDADTSISTTAFVAAAVAPTQNNAGRNLVMNGQFNVAQRGAGSFSTSGYGLDRWQAAVSGDTFSWGQNTHTDTTRAQIGDEAATYYLANTFTGTAGAGALTVIWQPIEDVRRLAGKTVTVSFWAIATAALKLGISFDQSFGSGGAPSATVQVNGQSVTLSTTWTRYSMTFALPSISGKTLGTNVNTSSTSMFFWYSSGSTNNVRSGNVGVQSGAVNLWGVQLEIGTVATPLDYGGTPQQQLAACQRFFQVVQCSIRMAASAVQNWGVPVYWCAMRAIPTITAGATGSSLNTSSINGLSAGLTNSGYFSIASAAAGDCYAINYNYNLSADL